MRPKGTLQNLRIQVEYRLGGHIITNIQLVS